MADTPLFITDLDGTLLDNDSKVSVRSAELLNDAIARGALFSVATARTPATVAELLKGIDLKLPLVVMTGAALWDPVSDQYIETHCHRRQDVERLLEIYRRHSLPTFIYTLRDHKIHIYHQGALSDPERVFISERENTPYKTFHIPEDGNSQLPEKLDNVLLLFAMQPAEPGREAWEEIKQIPDINTVFYHDLHDPSLAFIEAFPREATKANGIRSLRRLTGADSTIVFGDNYNDLPMMRMATKAIAVENAVEEVRKIASKVIGPNTSDSVAREINKLSISNLHAQ